MYICICWLTGLIQCAISHDELYYPAIADILWILLLVCILFHSKILHLTTVWKELKKQKHIKFTFLKFYSFSQISSLLFLCQSICTNKGNPGDSESKRICLQCRRHGFDFWVKKIPWRRKWQSTPVLPEEFYGQRSLVGYSPWGHKESDMTEQPTHYDILMYNPCTIKPFNNTKKTRDFWSGCEWVTSPNKISSIPNGATH